jgi:hypothetical protein
MENDLVSLYESNYLNPQNVVEEKKELPDFIKNKIAERKGESHNSDEDEDEDETHEEATKRKTKKSKKSMKNKSKEPNPGVYGDSFKRSGNIFEQILREMDEMGGGNFGSSSMDDNVFNADDQMDSGEEETFTLSQLRSMTLGEFANLLAGGDDEGEDYGEDLEDGIPSESYGFTGGEGNYKGDQGNYDGKANRGKPTTFVKGNGDADFGDQDTGYDPDDTEGSEGSHMGDQGDYDGKAKKQAPSSHVKANGDADFSKANTGIKTSSGKKPKNYF